MRDSAPEGPFDDIVKRLKARATSYAEITKHGNYAYGSAADGELFASAASTIIALQSMLADAPEPPAPTVDPHVQRVAARIWARFVPTDAFHETSDPLKADASLSTDVKGAPADAVERVDRLSEQETARANAMLDTIAPLSISSTWDGFERRTIVRAMLAYGDIVAALQPIEGAGMLREALEPFARVWAVSFEPFDSPCRGWSDDGIAGFLPTAWPTVAHLRRAYAACPREQWSDAALNSDANAGGEG